VRARFKAGTLARIKRAPDAKSKETGLTSSTLKREHRPRGTSGKNYEWSRGYGETGPFTKKAAMEYATETLR
jgi:hypothetical protein